MPPGCSGHGRVQGPLATAPCTLATLAWPPQSEARAHLRSPTRMTCACELRTQPVPLLILVREKVAAGSPSCRTCIVIDYINVLSDVSAFATLVPRHGRGRWPGWLLWDLSHVTDCGGNDAHIKHLAFGGDGLRFFFCHTITRALKTMHETNPALNQHSLPLPRPF